MAILCLKKNQARSIALNFQFPMNGERRLRDEYWNQDLLHVLHTYKPLFTRLNSAKIEV